MQLNVTARTAGLASTVESLAQEPAELRGVEAVATDDRAVQQQNRDVESVTALQYGIAVDVHDLDWR